MAKKKYYWELKWEKIKAGRKKDALDSIARGIALNKDRPTNQEFESLKRRCK
ncbi:hypothetical protein [Clostridium thermarum]|uniref:hypothetical protein n=1 Tax=Clostridium thermarum TaxID=1716543 RepID=UPI0015D66172|nr:hypothetical protein [Clostridium thermarum]